MLRVFLAKDPIEGHAVAPDALLASSDIPSAMSSPTDEAWVTRQISAFSFPAAEGAYRTTRAMRGGPSRESTVWVPRPRMALD